MQHADGEILACRAAHAAGIQYTLSTMSICSIEDVAEAVDKPFWFQLYVMRDRGFVKALIERATAAKCSALFLTVDLPVNGSAMSTCATASRCRRASRRAPCSTC